MGGCNCGHCGFDNEEYCEFCQEPVNIEEEEGQNCRECDEICCENCTAGLCAICQGGLCPTCDIGPSQICSNCCVMKTARSKRELKMINSFLLEQTKPENSARMRTIIQKLVVLGEPQRYDLPIISTFCNSRYPHFQSFVKISRVCSTCTIAHADSRLSSPMTRWSPI